MRLTPMCFPVSFTKFLRTPFYMKLFRCPFFSNLGKKWKNQRKAKQNNNSTLFWLFIIHHIQGRKNTNVYIWTYININVYIERTRVWPWFSHSCFSHAQVFFDVWNCYMTNFQRDRRQREKGNKEYDQTVEIKRNNEL